MNRVRVLVVALIVGWAVARGVTAGEPARPVLFQSAPGRFEVAAVDVGGGQRVVELASEAWLLLTAPLVLPESFPSPVFVRLVPAPDWREPGPFRVFVEAGGVVSVRVRWDESTPEVLVRRALVQALIMRQAVARHGVNERLAAPLWLEHACLGWWRTRAEPAQLDALRQASARLAPPDLVQLLTWQRGRDEPPQLTDGSIWLLTLLLAESNKGAEWATLLHRLLVGEAPAAALAASFPARFANELDRERWWQTGWHTLVQARVLPTIDATGSRAEIAERARFVFSRAGNDVMVPLREVLARGTEAVVQAEMERRVAALNRVLPSLHPFYRNAAISLAEALALRDASTGKQEAAWVAFERDWADAVELAAASSAALDALETKRR